MCRAFNYKRLHSQSISFGDVPIMPSHLHLAEIERLRNRD